MLIFRTRLDPELEEMFGSRSCRSIFDLRVVNSGGATRISMSESVLDDISP